MNSNTFRCSVLTFDNTHDNLAYCVLVSVQHGLFQLGAWYANSRWHHIFKQQI